MSNVFNTILKILAVLCVIAFVLATSASLALFNASGKLFDAQTYLNAFETQHIYDHIPGIVADVAASGKTGGKLPSYLEMFPAKDWETIVSAILPSDITRSITQKTVVSLFDFLHGKSDQAVVSLTEFKTFLGGPQGLQAVQTMIDNQPDCTPDQLLDMAFSSFFGDGGSFYLCRPPADLGGSTLQDFLAPSLQEAAGSIPDQIILLDAHNPTHANLVSRLRIVRLTILLSPLLPLGLLLLIALFAVRSLRDWFAWWGVSLILGGVAGLITAATIYPIFRWAFQSILLARLSINPPPSLAGAVRDLAASIITGVAAPIVFESILILLAGTVLLLATRFFKKPAASAPQAPANPTPPPNPTPAV